MKKFSSLFFAASLVLLAQSLEVQAQGGPTPRGRDSMEQMRARDVAEQRQIQAAQNELRMMEKMTVRSSIVDEVRRRQVEINSDLRELNQVSDALLALTSLPTTNNLKDVADLANKIAKISNRLRRNFNQGNSVEKIRPIPLPEQLNRSNEITKLAKTIDRSVSLLNESRAMAMYTTNGMSLERTRKHLETIEGQAINTRELARRKD
ncbi:MAG: hypothetical protein AB1489_00605 [Acidobacteriota bacterium]